MQNMATFHRSKTSLDTILVKNLFQSNKIDLTLESRKPVIDGSYHVLTAFLFAQNYARLLRLPDWPCASFFFTLC